MAKPNYAKIRQQVESRVKARHDLKMHAAVYLIVNILLWGFWFLFPRFATLSASDVEFFTMPWPVTVTIGWGLALAAQSLSYYFEFGGGARRREQAVQLEVEQEIARRTGDDDLEKPKNDQRFRLTEDGEIETVVSDDNSRRRKDNY
jgi:hypothetical protein